MENNNEVKEASSQNGVINDPKHDDQYGCQFICCSRISKRYPITCMQRINNAKGVLIFLCLPLLMEGIINAGLFNAVISTIEKRFQLKSAESGIIASSFDIFTCLTLVFITFKADKAFKPMWIGWGTFIMGVGCVCYSLPHFTAPTYSYSEQDLILCGINSTNPRCESSSIKNYIFVFIAANGLIGLGSTPLFTMAITYLDENVEQSSSALYNGIYYSMGALGPAIGYLLGSGLLNLYTDIGKEVSISSQSALWVGAWWLGFLVIGVVCMLWSFLILMFPRSLPGTDKFRENRNNELYRNEISEKAIEDENFGKSWKDMPKIFVILVRNLPYVCLTFSMCLNFAFIYGFNTFGTKYVESIFGITTSLAALYFGIAVIFAAASGQFLGGYIVTRFKLNVNQIIKFMILCTIVALLVLIGFLMHCENEVFVGGDGTSFTVDPKEGGCSSKCHCNSDLYEPICGEDGISYFSPCYAGCEAKVNESHYSQCSCLAKNQTTPNFESGIQSTAVVEKCAENNCNLVVPFLLVVFVGSFGTLITTTPSLQATLRCVPFNLRTQAISLQRLFFTLLGSVPGRLLSGKLLDEACVSWGNECGSIGACRSYDREKASKYMTFLLVSEKTLSLIFLVVTWLIYKPTKTNENTEAEAGKGNGKECDQNTIELSKNNENDKANSTEFT